MVVQVQTEALLTSRQVAQWLGISASTLCRMRQEGRGPQVVWLSGSTPRYRREDVADWLERQTS